MAINLTFKGLTGVRGTLTGFDEAKVISELIEAIATAEGLPTDYYTISKEGDPTNTNSSTVDDSSTTVDSAGINTGDVIICTPNTSGRDKDQRQIQKLEIAQLKRKGTFRDTVAYPNADDAPYYKPNNTYDLTSLPDVYNGNLPGADDNPNTGGLLPKRPWIAVGAIAAPTSITESIDGSTLLDLQVWYDGADITTYVPSATDEGQITQWTDKSSFAHNANPDGGSAKPTYENTVLQNGYGYLEFDGGDSLTVNPFTQLASQAGFTVFIVAKQLNTTGLQVLTATDQADLGIIGGSAITVAMAGATATTGPTAGDTNWHQHTLIYDGTGATNADKLKYRLDKTGKTLSFTGTVAATTNASNSEFFIGNDVGGTNGLTGYVGEVILFNKTLNATEYANVENYLSNKWGL